MTLDVQPRVSRALERGEAVVALESTVITHGLPRPRNLELAVHLEEVVRSAGATPATIAILGGRVKVGLGSAELESLAQADAAKASLWNMAALLTQGRRAGTTVAATLSCAAKAGIEVFATGGIGGVHAGYDESADLQALARFSLITVCAGPKSILNVAATMERLESYGVAVAGYRSDTLAGFHTPLTDLPLPSRLESSEQIARTFLTQRALNHPQGLLVSNPVSRGLSKAELESWLSRAEREAEQRELVGKDITPFMLQRLAELSEGRTVEVNVRLLEENARLAAEVALALSELKSARATRAGVSA